MKLALSNHDIIELETQNGNIILKSDGDELTLISSDGSTLATEKNKAYEVIIKIK